jgi:hypothetical protein
MYSGKNSGRNLHFNPQASARSDIYEYEEGTPGENAIKKEKMNQRLFNAHVAKTGKKARDRGVMSMGPDTWTQEDEADVSPLAHPFFIPQAQRATVKGKPNKSPRNLQPAWEYGNSTQHNFKESFPRMDRNPTLTTSRREGGEPVLFTTPFHPHRLTTAPDWTTKSYELDNSSEGRNPFYYEQPYPFTQEEFEQELPNYVGDNFYQGDDQSTSAFDSANQGFGQYSFNSEVYVPCFGGECPDYQHYGECTRAGCQYTHGSSAFSGQQPPDTTFDEDYFNNPRNWSNGSYDAGAITLPQQTQYYQQQQPNKPSTEFNFSFGGRKSKSKSKTKRRNKKSKKTKRNCKK